MGIFVFRWPLKNSKIDDGSTILTLSAITLVKRSKNMTYFSLFIGPLKNNLIRAKTFFWEKFREWCIWQKFYKMVFLRGPLKWPLKPPQKHPQKCLFGGVFWKMAFFNTSSFQFISTRIDGIETVKPHFLVIWYLIQFSHWKQT